jgi:hypothetical protein
LDTLAYKIEDKWGNQLEKTELGLEGEKELVLCRNGILLNVRVCMREGGKERLRAQK